MSPILPLPMKTIQVVADIVIRDPFFEELPESCVPQFETYRDMVYKYMYYYLLQACCLIL